jgi:mannose-6-phosphate isomerase-like protein (cupin superfamily)
MVSIAMSDAAVCSALSKTEKQEIEGDMPFFPLAQYREKRPGVFVKAITGRTAQLCLIKLIPGQRNEHSHAEEQMGYIFSGRGALKIGDEEKELGPGEGYLVPTGVVHSFRVVGEEALEFVEVFCPPKSDNVL